MLAWANLCRTKELLLMSPAPDRHPIVATLPAGPVGPSLQPEKRLMLAVLEGAVNDFQKYATAASGLGRRRFIDAEAWFASTSTYWPIDFESICQALAIEPSFVRSGLRRWYVARRTEPRSATTVPRLPFRRVSGTPHTIGIAS